MDIKNGSSFFFWRKGNINSSCGVFFHSLSCLANTVFYWLWSTCLFLKKRPCMCLLMGTPWSLRHADVAWAHRLFPSYYRLDITAIEASLKPGMDHVCNPYTWEADTGGEEVQSHPSATQEFQSQSRLQETLTQNHTTPSPKTKWTDRKPNQPLGAQLMFVKLSSKRLLIHTCPFKAWCYALRCYEDIHSHMQMCFAVTIVHVKKNTFQRPQQTEKFNKAL